MADGEGGKAVAVNPQWAIEVRGYGQPVPQAQTLGLTLGRASE
jgi:hypothetical protein